MGRKDHPRTVRGLSLGDVADGAVAGGVATAAMSAFMFGAQKAGLQGEQPPGRIVRKALDGIGIHQRSQATENLLATAAHLAFGASQGMLYQVLRRRVALPGGPLLQGSGFGLVSWLVNYGGWIPALRIMPPPHEDRSDRQATMIVAHVVYGAVLGALSAGVARPDSASGALDKVFTPVGA
ncbi:MAG: DUF1440 domain-containing protein [Actinomycetota bacterium]|nr:DUF1440 domain-containing protein [Actinomycetota bacterium]